MSLFWVQFFLYEEHFLLGSITGKLLLTMDLVFKVKLTTSPSVKDKNRALLPGWDARACCARGLGSRARHVWFGVWCAVHK